MISAMDTLADSPIEGVNPNIGAAYEITVFDTEGKPRQVIKEEAKCYVMNFLRLLRHWFFNGRWPPSGNSLVTTSFRNLTGSIVSSNGVLYSVTCSRDWYINWGSFLANAAIGDLTRGIIVGTGSTVVGNDDYKIETLIAHGSGAGQLFYDAVAFLPLSVSGNTITIGIARMMSNNGASPVPVNEIALYASGAISIMILRDLVGSSVILNPGESMLVAYKLILNG
jgi:hypothetical protein